MHILGKSCSGWKEDMWRRAVSQREVQERRQGEGDKEMTPVSICQSSNGMGVFLGLQFQFL